MEAKFKVTGMDCASCKENIEDVAGDFPEIKKCEVDLKSGAGVLEYKEGFDINRFKSEIDSLGKYRLEFTS